MIKKIKVSQLKPGAFVHDFNSGWLHHPFLANKVLIKTESDITKILRYQIHEVYIDTARGVDVDDAPSGQEVDRELQAEIAVLPVSPPSSEDSASFNRELSQAQTLIGEVKEATRRLMDDVRVGKPIQMGQVETIVERMTDSIQQSKGALISLVRIKNRDEYTYMHSLAVSALCISFARHLGFDDRRIKDLGVGGLLHDVGKVKIPDDILNKPGPLTEKEFAIMQDHVTHGSCILHETGNIGDDSIMVTAHHHERLDGTGYPDGLKGNEISEFGQMGAIVDIYDALTSERVYKDSMPPTKALKKLLEWSAHYVNRQMVEQFIAHVGIYPLGTVVRLRSGLVGVVVNHGERGLLHPTVRVFYDIRAAAFVQPFSMDLSKPVNEDEIVGCESPERWCIQPERYLAQQRPG
jgi:putative nucleotidyltransferase with HDIG domain